MAVHECVPLLSNIMIIAMNKAIQSLIKVTIIMSTLLFEYRIQRDLRVTFLFIFSFFHKSKRQLGTQQNNVIAMNDNLIFFYINMEKRNGYHSIINGKSTQTAT